LKELIINVRKILDSTNKMNTWKKVLEFNSNLDFKQV
jgi:hypothetical protein